MATGRPFTQDSRGVIRSLRSVIANTYCRENMNLSTVVGFLGEVLVGELLVAQGHSVEHLGKQANYDLRVPTLNSATIDVKTSVLKEELGCNHWGWALLSGSKKKDITFSHVVCVCLDVNFECHQLLVVPAKAIDRFPAGIRPFKNNKHILFELASGEALPINAPTEQRQAVETCHKLEAKGLVLRAMDGPQLVDALSAC